MARTIEAARELIETLLPMQEDPEVRPPFPCPRCGHDRMHEEAMKNALSRYAKVYVCVECGKDEAARDIAGLPPLPLNMWGMVRGMDASEEGEDCD